MDILKINDHVRTYPGDLTTAQRVADIQRIEAEIEAALEPTLVQKEAATAANQAAIAQHNKVDNYLKALKESNPEQFEIERKLPFTEQAALVA